MQFSKILTQPEVERRLISGVKENRISHAQLFLGPEGSGNLAYAIAYAQFIHCSNKQKNDSCGTCPSCIKMSKHVHPDVHYFFPINTTTKITGDNVISAQFYNDWRKAIVENPYQNLNDWLEYIEIENKQGNISERESDEIVKRIGLKAYEGEYKIVLIWMAERMNASCANKLLKVLEEPPDKTLFLLVAQSHEQLLPTIISRTQLVKFKPYEKTIIRNALCNNFGIDTEGADTIAQLADGNYNLALKNLNHNEEQSFYLENFKVWMRHCYKRGDFPGLVEWVEEFGANGRERLKNFLRYSLGLVRECMVMNYGSPSLQKLNPSEQEFLTKFHPFIMGLNADNITKEINDCYHQIERNGNAKIILLDATLKLNRQIHVAKTFLDALK